jgi:hypothetical protein
MGGYLKDQSHIKAPKPGETKDERVAPRFTSPAADQGEAGEVPDTTKNRVEAAEKSINESEPEVVEPIMGAEKAE